MGMALALMFVMGYVAYVLGKMMLVPGAKFLFMAPLLAYVLSITLHWRDKVSTMVVLNLSFGVLTSLLSPLMGLVVAFTGLGTGAVMALFQKHPHHILIGVSVYPAIAWWLSFEASVRVSGLMLYGEGYSVIVGLMALMCAFLGFLGGQMARRSLGRITLARRHKD